MLLNSIKTVGRSDLVSMGPVRLRQPIPTQEIDQIDPFVLLHHYGPYEINELNNPFDLGPHPHRGFEPITFLIQGEQLHRDSLGNESIVKGGDVQWTTAGRGIIHAEGPTKEFVERGGILEGIQLWLNLPAEKKMMTANYQHVKEEDFNKIISEDSKTSIKVIAGQLNEVKGKIETQSPVNAFMIDMEQGGNYTFEVPESHQSLVYLLDGEVLVNEEVILEKGQNQLTRFNQDGNGFSIS
ncbi:MAG: pirin family protein, partial [Flavobacteriaceae bacterium]|nr:pirin family protein [Flavobacteriaceae bacterium]